MNRLSIRLFLPALALLAAYAPAAAQQSAAQNLPAQEIPEQTNPVQAASVQTVPEQAPSAQAAPEQEIPAPAPARDTLPPRTPLMGWSSWNTYRIDISDSLILAQARALVASGLDRCGYTQVNIDDGFFGGRDFSGRLFCHPERFPRGMRPVVEAIHALGLRAGIYSDAGANTCGSIWDGDRRGVGVGLYGHEAQDADLYFNEWGFDFIKIDYCGVGQELALDERERYTAICRAIDSVARRPVAVNLCRWAFPGTWARQLAASWRISSDIAPSWESVRGIIARNLYLSAFAREGRFNDMDMLEIGRGLTPTEEQTHFGMWCMMASPLLIGCDLRALPEPSLELLCNEELIALDQDPLGRQARVVQHRGGGYVLAKDLGQERGLRRAVALYNPTDSPLRFDVAPSEVELGGRIAVRNLVRRKADGSTIGRVVPPHGTAILEVRGTERLEPTRYEAEWAYLPLYEELSSKRKVAHKPCDAASGGMTVASIGGSEANCALWDDVYSVRGGLYELTVHYLPRRYSRIVLDVNGERQTSIDTHTEAEAPAMTSETLVVRLAAGDNTVRIGSPYAWCPDIDCFTLRRIGD